MPAIRDKQGRFVKGESGNLSGRPGIPPEIKKYGKEAPERLRAIADDLFTPLRVKAEIEKWFAEMAFGKPRQQVDVDAAVEGGVMAVKFEGVLDEWSG